MTVLRRCWVTEASRSPNVARTPSTCSAASRTQQSGNRRLVVERDGHHAGPAKRPPC
jgi:hypothetical protein